MREPMKTKESKTFEVQPSEEKKAEEFLDKYKALCDEYKMRLVITPAFKARDDATWSVVLQTSVGRMPDK